MIFLKDGGAFHMLSDTIGKSFIIIWPFDVMTNGVWVWTTSIVALVSSASPFTRWFLLLWYRSCSNSTKSTSELVVGWATAVGRRMTADDWRLGGLLRKNKALASGSDVLRKTRKWIVESVKRDQDCPAAVRSSFLPPANSPYSGGFSSGLAKYDKMTEKNDCRWTCSDSAASTESSVRCSLPAVLFDHRPDSAREHSTTASTAATKQPPESSNIFRVIVVLEIINLPIKTTAAASHFLIRHLDDAMTNKFALWCNILASDGIRPPVRSEDCWRLWRKKEKKKLERETNEEAR